MLSGETNAGECVENRSIRREYKKGEQYNVRKPQRIGESAAAFKVLHKSLSQKSGICYTVTEVLSDVREGFEIRKRDIKVFMAREQLQQTSPEDRRRRVQRLKKTIVGIVAAGLVIPLMCCVYLICRLHTINGILDDLNRRLDELEAGNQRLQTEQQLLQEEAQTTGQTSQIPQEESVQGSADPVTDAHSGQEQIHKVYLTFDDGPSIYTNDILDILDRYQVKATFFVVGREGTDAEEALQRIVEDGHTLGMHSYSHKYKELYESMDSFTRDFEQIRDYVYQATGVESVYYRFPGGSSNTVSEIDMHEFIDYLESQGVEYYDWNVSSGDGGSMKLTTDTLLENCTKDIDTRDTSIILLHDSAEKPTTVEALPEIIENILARPDTVILPITENTKPVHHQ